MRLRRQNGRDGPAATPYLAEALKVAYYHCVLEMPLKSIAELLGKSPATITRRLDEVRRAGWLRDHPEFSPPPEIWRELQGQMTCTDVETALISHFGRERLQRATVVPSAPPREGSLTESLERVGLYAARRLSDALQTGAHVVGVNWGW